MNKINWKFDNSYSRLSGSFKENINPIPVKNPENRNKKDRMF